MEGAVRVCFRRLEILGGGQFPARGAALVVANHPAAWTDVVVLDVAFGRKLHFVAHQSLFHPWIRGLLLKLFASLPVLYHHEGPESAARNRETFDRCHDLFHRGEAIAIFPEGVSGSDRSLHPLKTGAARLMLEHLAAGDQAPALIPVAIHYQDRTAFRTRVTVAVGAPIPPDDRADWPRDPDAAAHALTTEMARALESALATAAAHTGAKAAAEPPIGRARARHRVTSALTTLLAAAGTVLHAVPAMAADSLARRFARHPQQLAFGRMGSGLVLFPVWYAGLVALAAALGGGSWFVVPALAPLLGALACREFDRRRVAAVKAPATSEESA
jgi:1-acyl-sn-glycerol-3-phosphate acyltransferase